MKRTNEIGKKAFEVYDDPQAMFVGSGGNLKPSKKRNYHKALVWIAIIVITITLAVIRFVALTRFKHG